MTRFPPRNNSIGTILPWKVSLIISSLKEGVSQNFLTQGKFIFGIFNLKKSSLSTFSLMESFSRDFFTRGKFQMRF